MAKDAPQDPHGGFPRRGPPKQGGGDRDLDVSNAQQLQHKEQARDAGDAGQYAGQWEVGEAHTVSDPVSNRPPS